MSEPKDTFGRAKTPRQWTAQEKLRVVFEAVHMSEEELGPFLRKEGLHGADLERWREAVNRAAEEALSNPRKKARKASAERQRVRELERDLRRKEKALAEVTALLALKKRVQELWGDEDDNTPRRNGT
jgi:hypothetical protein